MTIELDGYDGVRKTVVLTVKAELRIGDRVPVQTHLCTKCLLRAAREGDPVNLDKAAVLPP